MAHIKYYFQRDKNKYEQVWDYNEKLTKIISFITNWFWITDVTEISSNKRECESGFNLLYVFLGVSYILLDYCANYLFIEYSIYINIFKFLIILSLAFYPIFKFMFKISGYFALYYACLTMLFSPVFNIMVLDYTLLGLLIIIPGIYLNKKYLDKVKTHKAFELEKVEINEYSCYYIFNKYILKQNKKYLEGKIKNEIK